MVFHIIKILNWLRVVYLNSQHVRIDIIFVSCSKYWKTTNIKLKAGVVAIEIIKFRTVLLS